MKRASRFIPLVGLLPLKKLIFYFKLVSVFSSLKLCFFSFECPIDKSLRSKELVLFVLILKETGLYFLTYLGTLIDIERGPPLQRVLPLGFVLTINVELKLCSYVSSFVFFLRIDFFSILTLGIKL